MATDQATHRVFNFSPGPAALPLPVLEQVQSELLCLPGAGASVMEISHRGKPFLAIMESAERRLRELLEIPQNYHVLLLQGGSRLQFGMVPMNLQQGDQPSDYVVTGSWSQKALEEAQQLGSARQVWTAEDTDFDRLPQLAELPLNPQAPYAYVASNETIQGVQFPADLRSEAPLVCDSSSDFLSRPVPVEQYGLIFACAQKNAGPAGVTAVIIREDLLDRAPDRLPGYLDYRNHHKQGSMYNTPPTFAIYVMELVCKWLQEEIGGLAAMSQQNQAKAARIYEVIDGSGGFYRGHAQPACRSAMNVTFRLPDAEREQRFIAEARDRGLDGLKGHRSVGGIRASLYNAMPPAGVEALRQYMQDFHNQNG